MSENDELVRIIESCRAGDAGGFEKLIEMYANRCYGYFYRLTGNREATDDLLGELFVKLVAKIASFRGGSFESWLFKVASNVFHDHLRARQQQKRVIDAGKAQLESKAAKPRLADEKRIDELQVQLERLDTDTRELIMLRYYSQLSFKELAEMRGEPIGTTLSKVHRGLKKLRKLMER
ncbi:MAG: RNA polymerase sigma factor [Planctomycetota bacterium]|jgi:RNA polymerase sigma-70 factor (ECF subfamily)